MTSKNELQKHNDLLLKIAKEILEWQKAYFKLPLELEQQLRGAIECMTREEWQRSFPRKKSQSRCKGEKPW